MPAYVIGHITITDPEGYKGYLARVSDIVAAHGGTYLVRGGASADKEGAMPGDRHVVLQFATREAAEGWYHSDDYQSIIAMRTDNSTGVMTIVDGYQP